jgi:transcriptional regulator with XRE-family HTH domain
MLGELIFKIASCPPPHYQRGTRTPSAGKLPKIADVLGVSVEELYGIEKAPPETIRKAHNSREKQMEDVFASLKPNDQRALLKMAKGMIK